MLDMDLNLNVSTYQKVPLPIPHRENSLVIIHTTSYNSYEIDLWVNCRNICIKTRACIR